MANSELLARYKNVQARMYEAARGAERERFSITLIAVSKTRTAEEIEALLALGHRDFGENYVQEALEKWPALKARYPDVRLHLIGALQSNKAKAAVALFDAIHSVDRASLLKELAKEIQKQSRAISCFIQVNTGDEPQKAGVSVADLSALIDEARALGISLEGLMCIPPQEETHSHFALLSELADAYRLPFLSMGMSEDFEEAIRLGASHIRVGTAIFGERKKI